MYARVRVPERVGVCMRVHVVLLIQHATPMRNIVTSFVAAGMHMSSSKAKAFVFRQGAGTFNFYCQIYLSLRL